MPKAPAQQPGKGRPWASPAPSQAGDRKLIHEGRILGTAHEWNNTWGWIVPLQKISHPLFRGNKIYCHRKDVHVPGGALVPGSTVDFLLYADGRGLGAGDVREAEAGAAAGTGPTEDELLPEGWEKIWSDEHGEYYYWNKESKESSWVPPEMPEAPEQEEGTLPEGWSKQFDPENNEYYYWHAATKTTTWERPKVPAADAAAPAGEEEEPAPDEAEPEAQPDADGPVLGQQRVKGKVEKWQGFFGWIAPLEDLGEDLKPLLENRQDRIYCNWRDIREGTTIEAGSLVEFLLYADDNGLAASDVRLQKDADAEAESAAKAAPTPGKRGRGAKRRAPAPPKDAMAELERQWAEQDAQLGLDEPKSAAPEPAHGVAEAQETEDGPLLPGWEQHWSEEHSCFYYWHKTAKQASWERPCLPGVSGEKRDEKVWEGEGAEEGAAKLATPITPVASWAGKEITPLTPATAADKEEARLATGGTKQPSAAFRAAQASGMFLGRGWRGNTQEGSGNSVVKGEKVALRPATKPGLVKRPGDAPQSAAPGKGGWVPSALAKRPKTQ
mmetsp:Transcript_51767/g.160595  ORF Transcript_51767/g.160595 Transcript_51767/m.160595 type:complete len:555 (+) Transcript_51767:63-1727(+)